MRTGAAGSYPAALILFRGGTMAKHKNPPQTKADIAAKFNKRISELIASGVDPALLPERIESTDLYTHRELRQLASAAAKKNSEGTYSAHGAELPKIRQTYKKAMLNIINDRRKKKKKIIEGVKTKVAGKDTGMKRGEMGDIRSRMYEPLKEDRTFRSQRDEDYYIKSLPKMVENEHDKRFVDNIIIALKKNFGEKANNVIAIILKMNPSQVIKAYAMEELFDIDAWYEVQGDDTDEVLEILKNALYAAGGERSRSTAKTREYADTLLNESLIKEQAELARRFTAAPAPM